MTEKELNWMNHKENLDNKMPGEKMDKHYLGLTISEANEFRELMYEENVLGSVYDFDLSKDQKNRMDELERKMYVYEQAHNKPSNDVAEIDSPDIGD